MLLKMIIYVTKSFQSWLFDITEINHVIKTGYLI